MIRKIHSIVSFGKKSHIFHNYKEWKRYRFNLAIKVRISITQQSEEIEYIYKERILESEESKKFRCPSSTITITL